MDKIKILVISNAAWNNNNCFGSSYSNIFNGMEDKIEFASIYCQAGIPDNTLVGHHFQISEKQLLKNLKDKKAPTGIIVEVDSSKTNSSVATCNSKLLKKAKIYRFQILFWIRDMIWLWGRWKSPELNKFIDEFKPDIIWLPLYYSFYINRLGRYIHKYTNKPMISYVSDDVYTLKQFSLSPLYWIDRLLKRRVIKKTVAMCDKLYVISELQKKDYDKCFNKNCSILFKGDSFSEMPTFKSPKGTLQFAYTGNIGSGRWKSLAMLARAIKKSGGEFYLTIYTPTPITKKMSKALNIDGVSSLKPPVTPAEVKVIQSNSDILVHVEPLGLKGKLSTRHSLSTKIVDYLAKGKCILAIGSRDIASVSYLDYYNAALVAENEAEILDCLNKLINTPEETTIYAQNAWNCGAKNHQIKDIQDMIYRDLTEINGKR